MKHKIIIEETPNPHAKKFILDTTVINENKKITYHSAEECGSNEMAMALFQISTISALHFFENVITITTTDNDDNELIKMTILDHIDSHNPNIVSNKKKLKNSSSKTDDEAIEEINAILDKTIRPSLLMDGGDLSIVKFESSIVYIHYEGACGGCPSAQSGTLQAIQDILKSEYDPEIEVISV